MKKKYLRDTLLFIVLVFGFTLGYIFIQLLYNYVTRI